MHSLYSVFRRIQVRVGAVLARGGILEESRWKRPGSRRGGGGVERGGDACIALGGRTLSPAWAMQSSPPHPTPPPPLRDWMRLKTRTDIVELSRASLANRERLCYTNIVQIVD